MRRRTFLEHMLAASATQALASGVIDPTPAPLAVADEPQTARSVDDIHRDAVVVIMHDHMPVGPDVSRMLQGGITAKVYQLAVDVEPTADFRASAGQRDGWSQKARAAIDDFQLTLRSDSDRLLLARSADDILRAKREGKVAILLGVEGGKLLEGNIKLLAKFHELGLRELQLRWAVPNQIVETDLLTPFGAEVIRECRRLGIIVDLTHIPARAFYEALDLSPNPPIVSHGLAGGGDVDDRRMKALAERGGVLGIHFYSSYLGPQPKIERVVEQVDYIANLVGIQAIGLGVDFFPTTGGWGDFQRAQGTRDMSWAVADMTQMRRVTEALFNRNYPESDIRKILGGNFLTLCRKVMGS